MSLTTRHPQYLDFEFDQTVAVDTYKGERAIKLKNVTYLPATSGMIADGYPANGTTGTKAYLAYIIRAIFHEFMSDAVGTLVGIMHHKEPDIQLPKAMEPMRENGSVDNESLIMLLRKINKHQLIEGRYGLMLDLPSTPTVEPQLPYIATYRAKNIINWDVGSRDEPTVQSLNLVVLDETENVRQDDFSWQSENKYRVLIYGEVKPNEGKGAAIYRVGVFKDDDAFNENDLTEPTFKGRKLDSIPFVFVNSTDISPDLLEPPLIGLARLSLAIYRGEADYRQSLFMQSQDTLVVIGDNPDADGNPKTYRTGANASISIANKDGDAKFIGVDSQGLGEQRQALEADKKDAANLAGQLMDTSSRGVESGDALQMRVAARTASLNSIALTGAFALETILKQAAVWIGANPDEVIVTPNLDFADDRLEGKSLLDYVQAKNQGAPFSLESLHAVMKKRGLTDKDFEDELSALLEEQPLNTPASSSASPVETEPQQTDDQ